MPFSPGGEEKKSRAFFFRSETAGLCGVYFGVGKLIAVFYFVVFSSSSSSFLSVISGVCYGRKLKLVFNCMN